MWRTQARKGKMMQKNRSLHIANEYFEPNSNLSIDMRSNFSTACQGNRNYDFKAVSHGDKMEGKKSRPEPRQTIRENPFTERFFEIPLRNEDGMLPGCSKVTRDMTERRAFEEERFRRTNLTLEDKVSERTKELERAADAADAANLAKSEFLASMSHELRTPLHAIIGFSEVLRDRYFGDLNDKQTAYVKDILESGKHLLSLINDILDLSKVEANRMAIDLSPVHIKGLMESSLVMIKEKAYKRGIDIELKTGIDMEELIITADERKVKQVIFNMLSNAVKFTPKGGKIRVAADLLESPSSKIQKDFQPPPPALKMNRNWVMISVQDTGIGIAPGHREKIFEEFYQIQGGVQNKTPGTGLGLSLSKRLVEMHGGRIWVESEGQGKGSRFVFVLPLEPIAAEKEPGSLEDFEKTLIKSFGQDPEPLQEEQAAFHTGMLSDPRGIPGGTRAGNPGNRGPGDQDL